MSTPKPARRAGGPAELLPASGAGPLRQLHAQVTAFRTVDIAHRRAHERAARGLIQGNIVLKVEKVLGPGAKSSVVINPLKPGEYPFFDEFHPETSRGKIIAK